MYTAMFGMRASFGFLTANWGFVIFAVTMIAGFVLRAPREEQMMLEAFGEEYRVYQQKTGRFFSKTWKGMKGIVSGIFGFFLVFCSGG